jgi:hypothetical protein
MNADYSGPKTPHSVEASGAVTRPVGGLAKEV